MDYHEYDVPPSLRRHVQCVWRLRDPQPATAPQVIWPDGRVELIVHLGTPMQRLPPGGEWHAQAPVLFAAQQRAPIRLAAQGPVDCLGVRLCPAASSALAGGDLASLRDQIFDLHALDADFAPALVASVRSFGDGNGDAGLWALLEARLLPHSPDTRIERGVALLDASDGGRRVHELAGDVAMSLRSLQIQFLRTVGLAVKEYSRIQRLQAALRLLDGGASELAAVAAAAGFADQAHATRELQALAGLTPARLSRALREQPGGEQTLAVAAAFVRGHG